MRNERAEAAPRRVSDKPSKVSESTRLSVEKESVERQRAQKRKKENVAAEPGAAQDAVDGMVPNRRVRLANDSDTDTLSAQRSNEENASECEWEEIAASDNEDDQEPPRDRIAHKVSTRHDAVAAALRTMEPSARSRPIDEERPRFKASSSEQVHENAAAASTPKVGFWLGAECSAGRRLLKTLLKRTGLRALVLFVQQNDAASYKRRDMTSYSSHCEMVQDDARLLAECGWLFVCAGEKAALSSSLERLASLVAARACGPSGADAGAEARAPRIVMVSSQPAGPSYRNLRAAMEAIIGSGCPLLELALVFGWHPITTDTGPGAGTGTGAETGKKADVKGKSKRSTRVRRDTRRRSFVAQHRHCLPPSKRRSTASSKLACHLMVMVSRVGVFPKLSHPCYSRQCCLSVFTSPVFSFTFASWSN